MTKLAICFSIVLLLSLLAIFNWLLNTEPRPIPPPCASVNAAKGPVRIAVINDCSGSVESARIEPLQWEDFAPLIRLLFSAGGELRFGSIEDDSDQPLLSLRIETPPVPPLTPGEEGNPFDVAQRKDEYEARLAQYQEELKQWCSESEGRTTEFRRKLDPLLARKTAANRSDIWGAVARASLFLAEDTGQPRSSRLHLILISDGKDNVRKPEVSLPRGTRLFLVNGIGSVGSLSRLNPVRFESIQAAFRALETAETENWKSAPAAPGSTGVAAERTK